MKKVSITDMASLKKRKKRFWILLSIFVIVFALSIVFGVILGKQMLKNDYNRMKVAINNNDIAAMIDLYNNDDLLEYEGFVDNYEKTFLGNTNHNILQSGLTFHNENYTLDATDGTLVKFENDSTQILVDKPVSFINVWNNTIYYRENNSKQCMAIIDGESNAVLEGTTVGQILIDNGKLFYINLDDQEKLYSFDLEDGKPQKVIDSPIGYFAIIGNKILVISKDGKEKFEIHKKSDGAIDNSISNATSFRLNKKLYLSDGKNIISCSVNMRKEKLITKCKGRLIATFDDMMILQDSNSLYLATSKNNYLIIENTGICKYASIEKDKLNLVIAQVLDNKYQEKKTTIKITDIMQDSRIVE